MPFILQPMLRRVLPNKCVNSIPEFLGLQEQQLNDKEANLGFISFMAAQSQTED